MEEMSTESIIAEFTANEAKSAETPPTPAPAESAAPTPETPKEPQKYKYQANGREVEESIDQILKRASLGYNYAQRAEELNKREADYKTKDERIKQLSRWEEYDNYAKANPQWNEHVQSMWEKRDQQLADKQEGLQANDPYRAELQKLRDEITQKFNPVNEFVEHLKSQQQQQVQVHQDRQFDSEVKLVRDGFPTVDFDQADEQGRSLEYRVLNHMVSNKIPSFKAAFLDLHHVQLADRIKQETLEQHAKDQKDASKKGLLGRSPTPKTGKSNLSNGQLRNLSYDQLGEMMKQELGLM